MQLLALTNEEAEVVRGALLIAEINLLNESKMLREYGVISGADEITRRANKCESIRARIVKEV